MGTSDVAATWSGPLSPPMNKAARATRLRSSASENSPPVRIAPSRPGMACRARSPMASAAPASDGPDVRMIRRTGSALPSCDTSSTKKSAGHRRNGIARADVDDHQFLSVASRPARTSRSATRARRRRRLHHLYAVIGPIGRSRQGRRQPGEQIPLILDRMARPQLARTIDHVGVHPAPASHVVTNPPGGAGWPTPATTHGAHHGNRPRRRTLHVGARAPGGRLPSPAASRARAGRSAHDRGAGCRRRHRTRRVRPDR